MNVECGLRNAENELVECLILIFSAFRIPTSAFQKPYTFPLIPIITAFDAPDDAVFQPQVIHEATGPVIVGPFLYNDQFPDAIGFSMLVIPVAVFIILINSIISRMMVKPLDMLFLPNLDMVRFTAFGQDPGLKIANGD